MELLRVIDSKGRFLRDGFKGLGKSALLLPSLRKWLDFDERNDYLQHYDSYFYCQCNPFSLQVVEDDFQGQYVRVGVIVATMFGQKCQKCMEDRFETAMWYPEEVTKVGSHFFRNKELIGPAQPLRSDSPPFLRRHRPDSPTTRGPPIRQSSKPTSSRTLPSL